MLRQSGRKRKFTNNIQIGVLTAVAAGMVNVASVVAFFTFSSNVTGHMALFSEQLVRGNWHQVTILFIWLLAFMSGAFTANFLVHKMAKHGTWLSHSTPIFVEMALLLFVAFYGMNFYSDHLLETELLVTCLLFSMGTQNGMVATITDSVVKTTHVTGLFTDLGMELSMLLNKHTRHSRILKNKFKLHLAIAVCYFLGGVLGGYLFAHINFAVFYVVSLILMLIVFYDMLLIYAYKMRKRARNRYVVVNSSEARPAYVRSVKVR